MPTRGLSESDCVHIFMMCVHARCRTRSQCSPSDKRLAAVPAGCPCALDGDVLMQTFLATKAIASAGVGELALAGVVSNDLCPMSNSQVNSIYV